MLPEVGSVAMGRMLINPDGLTAGQAVLAMDADSEVEPAREGVSVLDMERSAPIAMVLVVSGEVCSEGRDLPWSEVLNPMPRPLQTPSRP